MKRIQRKLGGKVNEIHICTYAAPFGVVPTELDEVYPLSQHEIATPLDAETIDYTAKQVANYLTSTSYEQAFLLQDIETWKGKIATGCRRTCKKKGIPLIVSRVKEPLNESALNSLVTAIQKSLV